MIACIYIQHYLTLFFFFNDTATTEIYTLSLHDALPISLDVPRRVERHGDRRTGRHLLQLGQQDVEVVALLRRAAEVVAGADRKSTRLNSSHANISYAVFCLKKKKTKKSHIVITLCNPYT